ncbi:hypothetical protein JTB14_024721 [Gonioctena quinquepunctata]|nr:hypothetical protein JTB14_024721 [Gonioctena quinquepunctata]
MDETEALHTLDHLQKLACLQELVHLQKLAHRQKLVHRQKLTHRQKLGHLTLIRPISPINVLEEISPLPSRSSNIRFKTRKARGEKSEILTPTPHKEQLEEQRRLAEEKKEQATIKERLREEKARNKDRKGKRIKLGESSKVEQVNTF